MPTDEGGLGAGKRLKILAKEVSNMVVNTWSVKRRLLTSISSFPSGRTSKEVTKR